MAIKALRGASALALLFGTSGLAVAVAQQTAPASPNPQNQTVTATQTQQQATSNDKVDTTKAAEPAAANDRVVITGSLIATTPEDAPKPVEVFSAEDLKEQGSPTVTEFIRSLTTSYGDDLGFGQASPDVPQGTGFGNANLRGLGSNGTLVLMNGKNLAPWNGAYGADVNTVPTEALEAVEVLKDGASATYGAGAVGGVINFRTRRDINAPQVSFEKNMYDGSDGYYKIDFLDGWVGDAGNLLISLSHSYEAPLLQTARDFSNQPFNINPAGWSITGSNPGQFQPSTTDFYNGPAAGAIAVAYPGIQDLRNASDCTALGGQIANVLQPGSLALTAPAVPNTSCAFPQAPFQSLVNENTQTRAYAEFNGNIDDNMEFNFDVSYSTSNTYEQRIPSDPAAATAIDRAADAAARRGFTANSCFGCNYVVPVQVQNYSPTGAALGTYVRNPFIDDFYARTGTTLATLPTTGALYMGTHWRPFLFGGYPLTDSHRREDQFERDSIIIDAGVKGKFNGDNIMGKLLPGVHYEFSGQYNQYLNTYHQPDIFASRLQNALLGYGGPHCNAIDRVPTDYTSAATYNRTVGIQSNTAPGTDGCQWFNPFASGFVTSVINGASNPQFNAGSPVLAANATPRPTGYVNSQDMLDWMIGSRVAEYKLESGTFNGLISGQIPESFQLPGGKIGWALGSQWRMVEGRSSQRDDNAQEQAMATQPCTWPDRAVVNSPAQQEPGVGVPGCTSTTGAFYGTGRVNIVTTIPPFYYDTQTFATFAELDLPVLDNLNLTYNLRHEEYNGGDLKGDIYSIAGKYDVTDNLYVRASYGTNYRADNALQLRPGQTVFSTSSQGRFGTGYTVSQATIVAPGIGAENDKTTNIGIGWQSGMGEGRIRASVDFFEILIDGQVATTSGTTILNNVFGRNSTDGLPGAQNNRNVAGIPNTATTNSNAQFADCNSSLRSFVVFDNNNACVQGVTNALNLTELDLFQVNGPGFITNGIDLSLDMTYPLFDGNIAFSLSGTNNLVYKARGYSVNGILFDSGGDRLGTANYTRTGSESRRWRANAEIRWSNDVHNISLRTNYSSGTLNEAYALGALETCCGSRPIIADNPATTTVNEAVYSTYGIYPKEYMDFDLNYIYTAPFWKGLELRATVLNIFDKDPSPAQGRLGYYGATGNPRGRQFEVGFTKKF